MHQLSTTILQSSLFPLFWKGWSLEDSLKRTRFLEDPKTFPYLFWFCRFVLEVLSAIDNFNRGTPKDFLAYFFYGTHVRTSAITPMKLRKNLQAQIMPAFIRPRSSLRRKILLVTAFRLKHVEDWSRRSVIGLPNVKEVEKGSTPNVMIWTSARFLVHFKMRFYRSSAVYNLFR